MKTLKIVLMSIALAPLLPACQSGHQSANVEDSSTMNQSEKDALVYMDDNKVLLQQDSIITLNKDDTADWLDPSISPDGKIVAYTRIVGSEDRTISLFNLATKQSVPLKVPSTNFYGATWAPDGAHIAFNIFNSKSTWKVGVIKADNSGYTMLDSVAEIDYYSPTWKGKDKIVAHNLEKLFTLDLQGKVVDSVSFEELIGKDYSLSSSDSFFYSADGDWLFFNAGNVTDDEEMPGLMGPAEALYMLDIANGVIKRLSPKGVNVNRIFVSPDDRIFYEGLSKPFETVQLFETDLNGNVTLLVEKGNYISVSSNTTRHGKQI
ncbi:hypothetical protein [Parapedobacter tibetensis]|uniref:hypothetical protein n=1 Tax=Parapedobacter tibetensis TaxID=2972951 RepID=UPI00214D3E6E|nr:hypothetical protein [Parapedobacter tibetensis]